MKKKSFFLKGITALALSITTIFSCTVDEEINNEEFSSSNESFAVTAGNKYYLKGNNGRYVSHENGEKDMTCNRTSPREWEQFYLRQGSTGYWYIKGVSNDEYVSSENGTKDITCNRTALNAWEKFDIEYFGTANGNDVVAFKSRSNSKYISSENGAKDMTCNRTNPNAWEKFEVVPVDGDDGTSTPPPTSDTPGGVLGIDNDDWKLNGFTATPSSSATYYDDVMDQVNGNISNWSNNNYFYESNGWAYFKCYRGLGSSQNSNNPRVELRERTNGSNANWNGDNGTHIMSFTVRVDQLPNGWDDDDDEERTSGTLCFAQIHGPSGTNSNGVDVDDTIRLQFDGTRGQKTGAVKLKISGYITEEQGGGSESFSGYSLDTSYDVQLIFSNDRISVKINGSEVFGRTMNTAGNGSYFKIGNYLQSVQNGSFDGSYGLVGIKNLSISGH